MTTQRTDWRNRAGTLFATDKVSARGSAGMVVTNNPLGSAAGAEMLAAGGNAVDAAIASLFALTVVEPMMVGIFGAGMTTLRLADGRQTHINNYATAPAAATPDMYQPISDTWPHYQEVANRDNDIGARAVGVPGSLLGWCETLERYGTLSLDDVMQPAIRYASRGYAASQYLHEITCKVADDLAAFPASATTWLPDGAPLRPGHHVRQPEYAETLKSIAGRGPDELYNGPLGAAAADYIQSQGGLITRADLSNYQCKHTDVVRGEYRGHEIIGPAPYSAGGVHVVQMLNVLQEFDIAGMGFGTADSIHLLAEILKIGFEDRRRFTGDPDFMDVPVAMLTSLDYASKRRALIDLARAREVDTAYHGESNHTTHVTTADAAGNVVSATHTIHAAFGAKATVPGTGMLLNNTMNIFDPHPGLANSIAPGKRMTSSMAPIIVLRDAAPAFALGLVGGTRIFPSAFQAIVNMIDHGMSPQEAVEAPRIWTLGDVLEVEEGVPDGVLRKLRQRGHSIEELKIIGAGMGLIAFDKQTMTGASCWRADGSPIGIGGGAARSGVRFAV